MNKIKAFLALIIFHAVMIGFGYELLTNPHDREITAISMVFWWFVLSFFVEWFNHKAGRDE